METIRLFPHTKKNAVSASAASTINGDYQIISTYQEECSVCFSCKHNQLRLSDYFHIPRRMRCLLQLQAQSIETIRLFPHTKKNAVSASAASTINGDYQIISTYQEECGVCFSCKHNQWRLSNYFHIPRRMRCLLQLQAQSIETIRLFPHTKKNAVSASAASTINGDYQIISTYQEECGVCFSCKHNQLRLSDYFHIPRRMRCLLQLQAQSIETIRLFPHTKKNAVSASAASTINGDYQIISTYQEECGVCFSCKHNQWRLSNYFHIPRRMRCLLQLQAQSIETIRLFPHTKKNAVSASAASTINGDYQIISTYQEECGVCFSCKHNQLRLSDYFHIPRRMRCLLQLQAQSMETIKLFPHTKKNAVSASAASTINWDYQIISTYQEECGVCFSCKHNQWRLSNYFNIPRRMRCLLQLQAQSMETIKLFPHTKKNAVSASAARIINQDHQIISTYQEECGVGFSCKDNQSRPSNYFHIPRRMRCRLQLQG